MTPDEYSEMIESLKKAIARWQDLYSPNMGELRKSVEQAMLTMNKLPDMSRLIPAISIQESLIAESFARIADAVKPLHELMPSITSAYLKSLSDLTLPVSQFQQELSQKLQASIADSLRAGEDYMDESQRALLDDIDPGILSPVSDSSHPRWRLSFSQILTIISILFSIAGMIVQRLPDAQLDALIAQNAVANEQRDVLISDESEELLLLQQINDTNQQLLKLLEHSDDLSVDTHDLVDRGAQAADLYFDVDKGPIIHESSEDDCTSQDDDADACQD